MKVRPQNIANFSHYLVLLFMVFLMFIQPMAYSFSTYSEDSIALHDEKDTSEEERLTEHTQKEKIELQVSLFKLVNMLGNNRVSNNFVSQLNKDSYLEILIPPPEFC